MLGGVLSSVHEGTDGGLEQPGAPQSFALPPSPSFPWPKFKNSVSYCHGLSCVLSTRDVGILAPSLPESDHASLQSFTLYQCKMRCYSGP